MDMKEFHRDLDYSQLTEASKIFLFKKYRDFIDASK